MRRKFALLALLGASALAAALPGLLPGAGAQEEEEEMSPEDLKAAKAAEDDALRLGRKVFTDPALGTNERSCSKCHDNPQKPELSLKGVAARFPRWDRSAGKVISLQQKFVQMQERSLKARKTLPLGDDRWNALEIHLRSLSK